jgi:hypothetical protein
MKEDILEQIVEDWQLSQKGCFVKHNIKFRPNINSKDYISSKDSVHSDIDILSININYDINDYKRVSVFNCKSWQKGFNVKYFYENLMNDAIVTYNLIHGHKSFKYFREFVIDKWREAFINAIFEETNCKKFTYYVVCTKITNNKNNEKELFENSELIKNLFFGNGAEINIKIITLAELLYDYKHRINKKVTNYTEATEVGRLLQLIEASDVDLNELK